MPTRRRPRAVRWSATIPKPISPLPKPRSRFRCRARRWSSTRTAPARRAASQLECDPPSPDSGEGIFFDRGVAMIIDAHAHVVAPETLYAYKGNLIANAGATGYNPPKISDEAIAKATEGNVKIQKSV